MTLKEFNRSLKKCGCHAVYDPEALETYVLTNNNQSFGSISQQFAFSFSIYNPCPNKIIRLLADFSRTPPYDRKVK